MKKYIFMFLAFLTIQNVSALSLWDNVLLRVFPKTVLTKAAKAENEEAVKRCVGKVDFNQLDTDGLGLVHRMTKSRKLDSLKLLVKYGSDINLQSKADYEEEFTPLHYAADLGDLKLVKTLVGLGANIKATTRYGITPFNMANDRPNKAEGHIEVCNYLKEKGAYNLFEAARCGDIKAAKNFLKSEDVNSTTDGGTTPLHMAAMKGHHEAVILLLDNGANINSMDDQGKTPICSAIAGNKINAVQILVKRGANLAITLEDGASLLHFATVWGRLEIVKMLVDAGMDPHVLDTDGETVQGLAQNLEILDDVFGERKEIANYLQSLDKK